MGKCELKDLKPYIKIDDDNIFTLSTRGRRSFRGATVAATVATTTYKLNSDDDVTW